MKSYKEFLTESVIDRMEKVLGDFRGGVQDVLGFQVNIVDDHEYGDWLDFQVINKADRPKLVKALKKAGFKTKNDGPLGIIVK